MRSAMIIHSPSTRYYADIVAKQHTNCEFFEVTEPPTESIVSMRHNKDMTIAIGGGSVIDVGKILAGNRRCIAIPTTAAGAAVTPYAAVWGKKKVSVNTRKPILKQDFLGMPKHLPDRVINSTLWDCLSHIKEVHWSKDKTEKSLKYAGRALMLINKYRKWKNLNDLIEAGNAAGQAISITRTNLVHALSYPLSIKYGYPHGVSVGIMLPKVAALMGETIVTGAKGDYEKDYVIEEALSYPQAFGIYYPVSRELLERIL